MMDVAATSHVMVLVLSLTWCHRSPISASTGSTAAADRGATIRPRPESAPPTARQDFGSGVAASCTCQEYNPNFRDGSVLGTQAADCRCAAAEKIQQRMDTGLRGSGHRNGNREIAFEKAMVYLETCMVCLWCVICH